MDDKSTVTSGSIIKLLASKHCGDIFIPECKNGGSARGHLRMDAWAMKKSWANPLTICYEVKVNRSDFLNDIKWRHYLKYCHEYYFVCPFNLIQPNEVSNEIGLMWCSKNASMLYTKKKAPYRTEGIELEEVYKYILLWRTKICREYESQNVSQAVYWKSWLATKDSDKLLGYNVSRKIQQIVAERIDKVECRQRQIESHSEKLKVVEQVVKDLQIPLWHWDLKKEARKRLVNFQKSLPEGFEESIIQLRSRIDGVLKIIQGQKEPQDE